MQSNEIKAGELYYISFGGTIRKATAIVGFNQRGAESWIMRMDRGGYETDVSLGCILAPVPVPSHRRPWWRFWF